PGRPNPVRALDGVDVHVDTGEIVCLLGASGCGKSTLLQIAAGLEEPTSGSVLLDGFPVAGPGPDRGLVLQGYSLYPWRSVAANVAFGLELQGLPRQDIAGRVGRYLDVMGLSRFATSLPNELSGGMQQRVAIARAIATEPSVLLLDEPFGALDAQTRGSMQEFLLQVWRDTGATILMVTHDVEEAVFLSSRIYVMTPHPGRIADEVAVPFGPDRAHHLLREAAFQEVCERLDDLLHARRSYAPEHA
ncbi:MAG: ABC transporter ATP-binding protein, partial [Actinobacteria bacterium]|nr:ABC transporter ATP-binding protein [Actinomycetota bacterium]